MLQGEVMTSPCNMPQYSDNDPLAPRISGVLFLYKKYLKYLQISFCRGSAVETDVL